MASHICQDFHPDSPMLCQDFKVKFPVEEKGTVQGAQAKRPICKAEVPVPGE